MENMDRLGPGSRAITYSLVLLSLRSRGWTGNGGNILQPSVFAGVYLIDCYATSLLLRRVCRPPDPEGCLKTIPHRGTTCDPTQELILV
jgi:hypothetical protein